jgi:hypothetical protein
LQALTEINIFLISSWMEFWLVTVFPKYLNCAALSKDLLAIFMLRLVKINIIIIKVKGKVVPVLN